MRDDSMECSEELLSGLLDDELDTVEKRQTALHAASCPQCAKALGQLFAMRAAIAVPSPRKVTVPKTLWRGVRERLDSVDGLVRATNLSPERRRPLVSPVLVATCVAVLALAFGAKAVLMPVRQMPDELTRLHLQASFGPNDPGLHQAVSFQMHSSWQTVSGPNPVNMNGVVVLQTTYDVGGLAVSVFRLPANTLDTRRLAAARVGNKIIYLAGSGHTSMAAVQRDRGWDIVVARSPITDTVNLALTCPQTDVQVSPY